MDTYSLLILKWKSFIRHPLFEQTILFRLLMGIYFIIFAFVIYILGIFLKQFSENIVLLSVFPLLILDFILKFFFKKPNDQLKAFRRFPDSYKSITIYCLIKESLNFWNCYLLIFFFPYLNSIIYPDHGGWLVTIVLMILYSIQLFISESVSHIRRNQRETAYKPVLLFNVLSEKITANYLLINLYMIIRSPRLKQQFLMYLLLNVVYFYLINKQENTNSFFDNIFFISIIFVLFPIIFSQFIFSSEASFFDRLIICPHFKQILLAKYILFFSASFVSFVILLLLKRIEWESLIELTAIFLYCAGTITILSFCCILFVNSKIDLFGSHFKMMSNPPSVQSLVVLLIYAFSIILVFLMAWLFSHQVATYYMLITGMSSILTCRLWFNYLYRCFYSNRHEKMELFRI
jgi:hypothetical protein